MWFEGESLKGDLEVLTTPSGNILKELLKNNIKLGISSRGLGSVKEIDEDTVEVEADFSLLSFDCVSNPSTRGSFINENLTNKSVNPWNKVNNLIYDFMAEIK